MCCVLSSKCGEQGWGRDVLGSIDIVDGEMREVSYMLLLCSFVSECFEISK